MKKTLTLIVWGALICQLTATETTWTESTQTGNIILGKDDKLVVDGDISTTAVVGNNVFTKTLNSEQVEVAEINAGIEQETDGNGQPIPNSYAYGTMQLKDGATLELTNGGHSVGSLDLGKDATLRLDNTFTVTRQQGVSLGAGAAIDLTPIPAPEESGGHLSLGVTDGTYSRQALEIVAADHGADGEQQSTKIGSIVNTSTTDTVHLDLISSTAPAAGTAQDSSLELNNVYVRVHGVGDLHISGANMKNVNVNKSSEGNIYVYAPAAGRQDEDFIGAVKQVSTGHKGDVHLLQQDASIAMESMFIGLGSTVSAHQGTSAQTSGDSAVSTIRMENFKPSLQNGYMNEGSSETTSEDITPQGITAYAGAILDANLSLGTGTPGEYVLFAPTTTVNMSGVYDLRTGEGPFSCGIDMVGNNVNLQSGIVLAPNSESFMSDRQPGRLHMPSVGDKLLLFSNVDVFTLGNVTYDDTYFDALSGGIAGSEYFVAGNISGALFDAVPVPTANDEHFLQGWYIEYRETAPSSGLGNIYLVYQEQLVPEPTSATLSLLALAGLAARRRRR